jgi:ATP-binding cassette, subfamily C, bacterial
MEYMFHQGTTSFIGYFLKAYPRRSALMVGLLIFSGLAEGVGILTLLPVLELALGPQGQAPSGISLARAAALGAVGRPTTLGPLLGVITVAMALKGLFRWLAMKQVGYTVAHIATDLRLRLIRALMEARWSYFRNQPTGHLANSISNEAHRASSAYRMACTALAAVLQTVIYLALVFVVSWQVALLSMAVGALVAYLFRHFVAMSRESGQRQTDVMKSLIRRLTEALPGIKPIKAMGREADLLPLLEKETEGFNQAQQQQVLASEAVHSLREPTLVFFMSIGLFAILTWTEIAFTAVLVLVFLFYRITGQINVVQTSYQDVAVGESAFWSLHGMVREAEAEREEATGLVAPPELRRGIRVRDVTFSYGPVPILSNVDLDIPAGRFVTVCGPSGAGKTTLADLLAGLHRPQEGEVLIDDVPLADVDLRAWRSRLGYVPQETLLFNDTIFRNVTLGNDRITRDTAREALEAAGAWEFVSARPEGMETRIGELGSNLSGGQRQRISIARALVAKPRLLILDEATTALDPATEAAICETLRQLRDQVTILAISHQPAMQAAADMVYEIDKGRVIRREAHAPAGSR